MKLIVKIFVFQLLLISFSGCVSNPYQAVTSEQPFGHQTRQIAENQYWVTYTGHPGSASNCAHDFALLRSAELTKEHGFSLFIIQNTRDLTSALPRIEKTESTWRTANPTFGNAPVSTPLANRTPSGGSSPTIVDTQVSVHTVKMPVIALLIHFIKDRTDAKPETPIYAADEEIAKLKTKYKLKP